MGREADRGAIDPAVLDRLAGELGDSGVAQRIAGIYLELLEERVGRLCSAWVEGDAEKALETALTLKVTSATIGAVAVSGCAERVERSLRDGGSRAIGGRLQALRQAAAETLAIGFGAGAPTPGGRPRGRR